MEELKDRIIKVRKKSGLSQEKFAARIELTRVGLQSIEYGKNNPSPNTRERICSEFKINRTWLETGDGPMQMPEAEDDELIDEVMRGDDEFVKAVIRGIARAPGGWEKMREVFEAIQKELDKKEKPED